MIYLLKKEEGVLIWHIKLATNAFAAIAAFWFVLPEQSE